MGVIREMDYRHENINSNLNIDTKLTEIFIKNNRSREAIEQFELWASMSKEREKIMPMINQYKNNLQNNIEDSNTRTLAI